MTKPLNSILVKPAGPDCNMKCTYCFYLKKSNLFSQNKIHRMSEKVLKNMVQQVMKDGEPQVSFAWQGGEPTLMVVEFFKKALEFQQKFTRNQTIVNSLQTNGILINRDWARFLERNKFLVGLSLDGPEYIHNKYRKLKGGKPSWEKVVSSAKLLLDSGVLVNALTVVNDYSVQFPEEIYEFHKSLGLNYMQFIPCVESDPVNPGRLASFSVDPVKFGKFLIKLFDLWIADSNDFGFSTSIRYFDSLLYTYIGLPAPDCALQSSCGIYVVVEHNGNVYGCDFFVNEKGRLGNVMEGDLREMLNSPFMEEFGNKKLAVSKSCQSCKWFNRCFGGCIKNRLDYNENYKNNYLCQSYKMFFNYADTRMIELAKNVRY